MHAIAHAYKGLRDVRSASLAVSDGYVPTLQRAALFEIMR